ncbi:type II toxin-antitoxin system CcdA family antitoxin [Leclercia adecarboxylata]|uniref:type II toxin-antitoxin system CcdA family antitoxin n=1 Tax=Leclercia adecarboxylata TaxID=83655 RepID=UPI00202A9684|nr:type II toxin-antitoxin system CcdA family antitoxin [Leclercia adecarboxylata]URO01403.1 type II toxin-antitoxin system CcdA family antitoxin [Leclercia adecarboxylata]
MKVDAPKNTAVKEHLTGATPRPALTPEERIEQRKRDKEFMRAMNEFVAKAGLLSDDPFFGGI